MLENVHVGDRGQLGDESVDLFFPPAISHTGRYIAYGSRANNLVDGDHALIGTDCFLADVVTRQVRLLTPYRRPGRWT